MFPAATCSSDPGCVRSDPNRGGANRAGGGVGVLARGATRGAAGGLARLLAGGAARIMAAGLAGAMLAGPAAAQVSLPGAAYERQVVLELFTAQGCAACPPADAMLAQLAMREDVIALALHVDYWDYIGWADTFALAEHTERQMRYARRNGHSTIYTPQVIVNGADVIKGFHVMQVMNAIDEHRRQQAPIVLELSRASSGALEIHARRNERATGNGGLAARAAQAEDGEGFVARMNAGAVANDRLTLHLIRYIPTATVEIESGENAGRRGEYHNIVTSWQTIATWDMRGPLEMSVQVDGSDPLVVVVQERAQGEIVAAARLR